MVVVLSVGISSSAAGTPDFPPFAAGTVDAVAHFCRLAAFLARRVAALVEDLLPVVLQRMAV